MFKHPIPSPLKISVEASNRFPIDDRSLPNEGLTAEQMAAVIRSLDLDPYPVVIFDPFYLKYISRAYLHAKIPIIIISDVYDSSRPIVDNPIGSHAVTITGYRFSVEELFDVKEGSRYINSVSKNIIKLYAHDDQVGPFARMEFISDSKLKKAFPGRDCKRKVKCGYQHLL